MATEMRRASDEESVTPEQIGDLKTWLDLTFDSENSKKSDITSSGGQRGLLTLSEMKVGNTRNPGGLRTQTRNGVWMKLVVR